uniref:Receptor-like protein kinase BRI1-like 3 n=1 Tax=Cajanus cajan TaxID=3821 RepID=A0A151S3X2_CAJCA|nr:Receptor-like protein kinase BRI1-like 3 [Cajanus cajan]
MLSTWTEDEDNRDCCTWKGIHCNNETGQVHELHLRGSETYYLTGTMNITSLIHLQKIERVDLSYNNFMWNGQAPSELGNLSKFKYLDLSGNSFSGAIPFQVGNLPILHTLILGYNLNLKINDEDISFLFPSHSNLSTSLSILDLSDNMLTSSTFQLLFNYSLNLRQLYLSGNDIVLSSSFYPNFPSLVILDLSENNMTSSIFEGNFNFSSKLRELYLHGCCLTDKSFLVSSASNKSSSSSLVTLVLSYNSLKSSAIFNWIFNFTSNLRSLYLNENWLEGLIPDEFGKVMKSLEVLHLETNKLQGEIPASLWNIFTLKELYLNRNNLSGEISNIIQNSSHATTAMLTLDLSNNQITGQLPNCWKHLKNSLELLDLSNNKLSGKIPKSIGTLVNLQALVLRNNSLTGGLPFTLKNCTDLVMLDVSENFLFGPIPLWIGENLQELIILSLRVNRFFRSVPANLCYLRQIHFLDLSRNNLSGGIPTCLGHFTELGEREITTYEIVKGRKITSSYTSLDIYDSNVLFTWKGQDYVFWNPEFLLKSIDLSSNDLTGAIPKEIGYLVGLVSLNLSRNKLDGEIPTEIENLSWLEFLDLSRNKFSGKIPFNLSKIDRLGVLDLSNNDLSGRIPWEGHLETFDASSFEGNLELCGEPLNKSCPGDKTTAKPQEPAVHGEEDNSVFNEALYMSLGLGFFAGFWGLLGPIILWKPWRIAYLRFLNRVTDYVFVTVELNIAKCCRWSES